MKVTIKSLKDVNQGWQQFLAEAAVMTDLRHPNLVQLIGVNLDEKPVFIITEFMEKGSLVDYLRSRGRAIIQKQNQLGFARDVADGMAYMEHKDLIHRWEGHLCQSFCITLAGNCFNNVLVAYSSYHQQRIMASRVLMHAYVESCIYYLGRVSLSRFYPPALHECYACHYPSC